MSEPCLADAKDPQPLEGRIVRIIEQGDTVYELWAGACKCGQPVHRLMRTCGTSLSVYEILAEDAENIEAHVAELHASFAFDIATRMIKLRDTIQEYNSAGLFEAEGMLPFAVRLIDRARLITNRFSKNGLLKQLLEKGDDPENDIASAFILGCIATENQFRALHERAVIEGYAHIEGREAGRPLALAARMRQGKRTRSAVRAAAAKLYERDPLLQRNDTKTAEQIINLKLETLRKRDGTFLGRDAIVKHLRAIRRAPRQRTTCSKPSSN